MVLLIVSKIISQTLPGVNLSALHYVGQAFSPLDSVSALPHVCFRNPGFVRFPDDIGLVAHTHTHTHIHFPAFIQCMHN